MITAIFPSCSHIFFVYTIAFPVACPPILCKIVFSLLLCIKFRYILEIMAVIYLMPVLGRQSKILIVSDKLIDSIFSLTFTQILILVCQDLIYRLSLRYTLWKFIINGTQIQNPSWSIYLLWVLSSTKNSKTLFPNKFLLLQIPVCTIALYYHVNIFSFVNSNS